MDTTLDSNNMNIVHILRGVGPKSFGPGQVALHLASAQLALQYNVGTWCLSNLNEVQWGAAVSNVPVNTIAAYPVTGPKQLGFSRKMFQKITSHEAQTIDILHQHGLWTGVSWATNRWRALVGKPTVIAPHGSLEPWAVRHAYWKKRIALSLYEYSNLYKTSCLHALSESEANDFRKFGLRNPIAIIPNGIATNWLQNEGKPTQFRIKFGLAPETKIILFLGRITPKKGLPMLVQAMGALQSQMKGWKLIIAGVDEFQHEAQVQQLVQALALQDYVQFVGPLFGQDKQDAFSAADLFILPSYSEGSPVTIIEALGAGVPVLTTKSSDWAELVTHGCGWWSEISNEGITNALQDVFRQSRAELQAMGQRGRTLITRKYTWSRIAEQTLQLYDWLLHGGTTPPFVVTG